MMVCVFTTFVDAECVNDDAVFDSITNEMGFEEIHACKEVPAALEPYACRIPTIAGCCGCLCPISEDGNEVTTGDIFNGCGELIDNVKTALRLVNAVADKDVESSIGKAVETRVGAKNIMVENKNQEHISYFATHETFLTLLFGFVAGLGVMYLAFGFIRTYKSDELNHYFKVESNV